MFRSIWILFICCCSISLQAQSLTDPLLPQLKDCHMVLRIREVFPFPGTAQQKISRDTVSVFLIGPDGWANTRYLARDGQCQGLEKLRYADGRLLSIERFRALDRHSPFASLTNHRHQISSRDTWEYRQGRISRELNYVGPDKALGREIRFNYDAQGRVTNKRLFYPAQKLVYYPERFDAIQYEYAADSVFQSMFILGKVVDSLRYEASYENGQRVHWRFANVDGLRQEERCRFDSTGKLCLNEWMTNEPAVENGKVRRPDKIEYRYDELGRIQEIRCMILGLRCEAYYYVYLR